MAEITSVPNNPTKEQTAWTQSRVYSEFGKSFKFITCGFCGATVKAFLWSLAGGGKKCPCGAKHNAYGTSTRKKA